MRTRDGIRLDADVYVPEGEGPFPVLLMRQPYGRAIASTIVYAHPRWYAAQGYIVVIQDVRGRGSSTGKFQLFTHEVEDGEDSVKWAAELPGSSGQVGMYGFSYQGMTQLYAAQNCPQALKAIAPAMTGYHLYEDWAYENGALCLQLGLTWAIQLAAETARIAGDKATYQTLLAAAKHLPIDEPTPAKPKVLSAVESFFTDWVECASSDRYWQDLIPDLTRVSLPTFQIGGWFDPHLRGDLRLYREMSARDSLPHQLWVGPWGHIPWGRKVGAVDFGAAAISPVDRLQVQWFDWILKGEAPSTESSGTLDQPGLLETRAVNLFEMGRNQWRQWESWPDESGSVTSGQVYFLQSTGLANLREDDGQLLRMPPSVSQLDTLVHDPWNPVPALGGHSAIPAGSFERSAIDGRGDVLTYTTEPLAEAMSVAGIVEFWGAITTESISYDLCVVLSSVKGDRAYNLTQGYRRVDTAEISEKITKLPLHPTCFGLSAGDRLRISISAACFPAYPINPGTGDPSQTAHRAEAQIISLAIALGGKNAASLHLPTVPTVTRQINHP
ncbi:MAG: S15 family X-Pro dipeptidyl-peptidase [Leptolyngbya foveolarum]|uniref:S15 family X-Pro dipeptidyl-peptidase n=1 Tax=Leptolyngbya foveolarum TaxID=47253 RepID=A0A2W4WGK8_9CYAN|nr:MAG: S15 family X-Pro dipeptidyl-peptidase [Leptolyngbya foveolarum]